nr:MAG TPA: hypothetical protein [Caudoviricetes sp.]
MNKCPHNRNLVSTSLLHSLTTTINYKFDLTMTLIC